MSTPSALDTPVMAMFAEAEGDKAQTPGVIVLVTSMWKSKPSCILSHGSALFPCTVQTDGKERLHGFLLDNMAEGGGGEGEQDQEAGGGGIKETFSHLKNVYKVFESEEEDVAGGGCLWSQSRMK